MVHTDEKRTKKNTYERERRAPIRNKINKQERINSKKIKLDVFSHYSIGDIHCLHCGETKLDLLTIDHINGKAGYDHDRSFKGNKLYRWLKRNNFPSGFQVLCWNWNQIKEKKWAEIKHSTTKDAIRKRKKDLETKILVLTQYSKKNKPQCTCCEYKELDGLSIDHIDGRDERYDEGLYGDKIFRWLKKQYDETGKWPIGFQTHCFSCNWGRKMNNGTCPHKNNP